MKRKARGTEIQPDTVHTTSLHESVPAIAFELALYRLRVQTEVPTSTILKDYLREIGA